MTAPALPYATLGEAARALAAGAVTSVALTEQFLGRIAALNPTLGAITDLLQETAHREAERADRWRADGRSLGPLAGIPVLVKDIIDTPPAVCSAGLSFLADHRPKRESAVVRRLRRAGAVILGVTATDPGAFGVRTAAVRHPQAPDLTVGGSSGGSGAAIAAGLGLAALGTDTGGSIRIPAACCGVVGLKPTRGRVSTEGVRPLVWSLDHVGPLVRRASDLPLIHTVLDPGFAATVGKRRTDALRIGHDATFSEEAEPAVREGLEEVLAACRDLGAELRDVVLPNLDDVLNMHMRVFCAEAAAYHLDAFPDHVADYPDGPRRVFDFAFRQTGMDYVRAVRQQAEIADQVSSIFRSVDLVLVPSLPVLTPRRDAPTVRIGDKETDFTRGMIRYTCLFDHTGNPTVAMPSKPFGPGRVASVQVVAPVGRDAAAVAFATALEARLGLVIDHEVRM